MTERQPARVEDLPPPPPMSAKQWATFVQYVTVWEAASWLPDRLARRLPTTIGDAWFRFANAGQREQVRRNQARVQPQLGPGELDDVVREAYRAYARYWIDSFRAHRLDQDDVLERTERVGIETMDAVVAEGRGAILATGHLGSWEIGAFFSTSRGWRLTVVAEVVEPRPLFDRFVRLRRELGMEVIPLVRGGDMVARLERVVREGGTATLLADRDLTKKGPIVEFFGEPCRLPPGSAALARRTKRPVVPGAFFATAEGWRGVIHEPLDISHLSVEEGTQRVAYALEALILEAPPQWHVFVPNWLADREPDHPALTGRR